MERFLALVAILFLGGCFLSAWGALAAWAASEDVRGLYCAVLCLCFGLSAQRILDPGVGDQ